MDRSNDPTTPISLHWVDSSGNPALVSALAVPPPDKVLCANIDPDVFKICGKEGDLVCSACRLVSYCSSSCQKKHWKKHKIDCSSPMRSAEWKPSYMEETRPPAWISHETLGDEARRRERTEFASGLPIWASMPAVDFVNLDRNEKDSTKDFNIALIGREPFHHFLETLAGLPEDYSGKLEFLISDGFDEVVGRFLLAVLILGFISDTNIAVDMVIHLLHSVFLPKVYLQVIKGLIERLGGLLEGGPLGLSSNEGPAYVNLLAPSPIISLLRKWEESTLSTNDAQNEYDRMRTAPHRKDFRERMYSSLRPSHRLAFWEFRRFGLLLPFGALNAHFNAPNVTLFSADSGKWLQTDHADPLYLYNFDKMIAAGQAHGTRAEDIYGCLYFYLFDRLRLVKDRIQRWRMLVDVVSAPTDLVPMIVHPDLRFHRIEVANMVDYNYLGVEEVLRKLGPILDTRAGSAIVSYFMNWTVHHPTGDIKSSPKDRDVMMALDLNGQGTAKMFEELRDLPPDKRKDYVPLGTTSLFAFIYQLILHDLVALLTSSLTWMQIFYDNSQQFEQYLERKNVPKILKELGLRRRERNTIVPHRTHGKLGDEKKALPVIGNLEDVYYKVQMSNFTFVERFVEFVRK